MDFSDDDEELKLAIALSLQDQEANDRDNGLLQPNTNSNAVSDGNRPSENGPSTEKPDAPPISSVLGLDRAAMERERLARAATRKRQASASPPAHQEDSARPAKKAATQDKPDQSQHTTRSNLEMTVKNPSTQTTPTSSGLQYPRGVIKKTWAFGYPRDGDDVTFEEVLQGETLKTAVFSSFDWDLEWLADVISSARPDRMVFVRGLAEEQKYLWEQDLKELRQIQLCFPDMSGPINCMHSKLILLSHPTHLRIAIPSANLTKHDWGRPDYFWKGKQTAALENTVFLIDLPRRTDQAAASLEDLSSFGKELLHFLKAKGLSQGLRDSLLKFDFSNTRHLAFVHSIGGIHFGEDLQRTGLPGLSKAIKDLSLQTSADLELDYAASSIGSLKEPFLADIHRAAQGRYTTAKGETLKGVKEHFRVYFPTRDTVWSSNGGPNGAGKCCIQRSYYESAHFPKECMRDYKSVRKGLLGHNKILFVRSREGVGKEEKRVAWVYQGSANLSESAWGKVVKDRSRKEPKLTCRNWECGVMMAVDPAKLDGLTLKPGEAVPMSVFEGLAPVPFEYPGEPYGDHKEPWFYQEHQW